jgi:hypothetical protein
VGASEGGLAWPLLLRRSLAELANEGASLSLPADVFLKISTAQTEN